MFFFLPISSVKGLKQEAKKRIWQVSSIFVYKNDKSAQYNFKLQEKKLQSTNNIKQLQLKFLLDENEKNATYGKTS